MRKLYLALAGTIVLAGHVSAQSDVTRARWKSAAIAIDGNDGEWKKPLNLYDDKSGILYAIANDQKMLYLDFTVGDRMKMRKMMTSGWSVDLLSKEKGKKLKASLIFPAVKLMDVRDRRNPGQKNGESRDNSAVQSYEMMLRSVELKGFRSNRTETSLRSKDGVDIAVGQNDEQQLVCEIAIPLQELFAENTIRLNELITLEVNVNAATRPSGNGGAGREQFGGGEMGGRMGGGMRGGGGRMGGGMSGFGGGGEMRGGMEGGSRGGEGMSDRSAMFEKASFKQKFKLTDN